MKQDIIKAEQSIIGAKVKLTSNSLTILLGATYKDWIGIGHNLRSMAHSMPWWVGDWALYGETNHAEEFSQEFDPTKGYDTETIRKAIWVCEKIEPVRRRTELSFAHHQEVAHFKPKEQDKWLDKAEKEGWSSRDIRDTISKSRIIKTIQEPPPGKYRTVVIDPPWPVEKILREVRPNQTKALDYKTMSIEEIKESKLITKRFADDCHVYLWTTHKFLPVTFSIFEAWGVNYECLLTWSKNVGMTPFSWMYSTEHCLFGRKGSLDVLKKGERLDFSAKVREHSRKPEEFYELVKLVSPEPRIDIFARGEHEGFDRAGDEIDKF